MGERKITAVTKENDLVKHDLIYNISLQSKLYKIHYNPSIMTFSENH